MQLIVDTQKLIEKMQLFDKRSGQWIFFNLWPRQVEFLEVMHNNRKVIIVKKRQTGLSQLTGADSLSQCMILSNFTVLILSKSGPDAKEYLNRVSGMYNSLPPELKGQCQLSPDQVGTFKIGSRTITLTKDNAELMQFENGSRILSLPANRGAGFTADRVVIDEGAFITKSESHISLETVLQRVEPTLDKAKGQLIIISTANGMNTFYEYYKSAKAGLKKFYAFFFSCWEDPTFTPEEREQKVKDFGEDHTNQEYPRTDREAFLSSGRPRFDAKSLQHYEETALKEFWRGFLMQDSEALVKDDKGDFVLYERIQKRTQYAIITDVSEGIENELKDPDYSDVKIIKISDLTQVANYHCRIEPEQLGIQLLGFTQVVSSD